MLEKEVILGEDFWNSLSEDRDIGIFSYYKNKPESTLNHSTHKLSFRVKTEKTGKFFHTLIFNESLAAQRESSQIAPLDITGYLAGSKSSSSFDEALRVHTYALSRLNEFGY